MKLRMGCVVVGFLSLVLSMAAQTLRSSPASAQVPPLIQFSNVATDEGGNTLSGVVSMTFSLYNRQQGGEPLWTETQNDVQLDPSGHYSVQLGITEPNGVPTALFTAGQARWLGVRIAEQAEQPRVLLVSVPYALKAGDAATVGGLPPSAFALATPGDPNASAATKVVSAARRSNGAQPAGAVTGSGTTNYVPLWTSSSSIGNSVVYQSGSGSSAKIGIHTTTPTSALDVKGNATISGLLTGQNAKFSVSNGTQALSVSESGSGLGIYAKTTSGKAGIYGFWNTQSSLGTGGNWDTGVWGDSGSGTGITGTSDSNDGVLGQSTNGVGVAASSTNSNAVFAGTFGATPGVWAWAYAPGGAGVMGVDRQLSNTGSGFTDIGVWGDTGVSGNVGVLGTADDGNGVFGKNNSVNHESLYAENDSGFANGQTPLAARFAGPGASTYCYIPRDAADNGTGDLVCTGSKSAAVAVDGNRMVRLYAVEAADNWFEDAGAGQLSKGSAAIRFESAFSQTINPRVEYHIFLTPKGECEGLYVSNESADGFEVHELHGGHSNIAFDYRIMARRKGFENVRMQDVSADFARMKGESDMLAARLEARKQEEKAHPKMVIPAR